MINLHKLDRAVRGVLAVALVLSLSFGIAGSTTSYGGPAAPAAAAACVPAARIEESAKRLASLTAAVTAAEAEVAKAKAALEATSGSTTTRARPLNGALARANAALTAARAPLKAAQAKHARLVANRCSDGGATTTPTVSVEYVSSTATRMNGADTGEADSVEFRISFKVTASGEDVYVDGDTVNLDGVGSATDGLTWSVVPDSTTGTGTVTALVTATDGYGSADSNAAGDRRFKVADGQTRTFVFTALVLAGTDNSAVGLQLNGLKWDTTSRDVMASWRLLDANVFRTDLMTGLYVR